MWIDYQEDDKRQGRIVAGIATLLYALLLSLLFLLVKFSLEAPEESGGLMIGYGNVGSAAPGIDLPRFEEVLPPQSRPQPQHTNAPEEILTQDYEDAHAVEQPQRRRREPAEAQRPNNTPQSSNQQTATEQPRQVNPQALFPGQTTEGPSTSTGTGEGAGNQGSPDGEPGSGGTGTGSGGTGTASLQGRMLTGALPPPDYSARNEGGRVIVEIRVDKQGNVTSATHRRVGSTTSNSDLIEAALRAARRARFNVDEDAPVSQAGTITYTFRLQ